MSWLEAETPRCTERDGDVSLVIRAHRRDLGGFSVRRVLPAPERRMVGPFVFFDEMGPAAFAPGQGLDVRPHPHIGLSTVTYLFEGEILHRDSLGYVQPIRPGAVNLMTAGRGIVHSERSASGMRASGQRLHGLQIWMALPEALEETTPAFQHVPAAELPVVAHHGVRATVVMGAAFGARSPVPSEIETVYVDLVMPAGSRVPALPDADERAVYVVSGQVRVGSSPLPASAMGVVAAGRDVPLTAMADSRLVVIGGASPGDRHLWWNFVSSSRERIEQAKARWRAGQFPPVPGDDEFIPLPED